MDIMESGAIGDHRAWCAGFVRLPIVAEWWESERDQPVYTRPFIDSIESAGFAETASGLVGKLAQPTTK